MSTTKRTKAPRDVAFLHGPTEDGQGARVMRLKDGVLSAGEIRPAREGEPLNDRELVRLAPLHEQLPICEVEVLADGRLPAQAEPAQAQPATAQPAKAGPAQVATESYRKNWSAVFGPDRKRSRRERDYSVN